MKASKELIRDINSRLVLETILHHGMISRASIAKETGLTKATVSAITLELINNRLIAENGSDDTSLGRKPILLSINKKAGYIFSIMIKTSTISVLLSDMGGEESCLLQVKLPKNIISLAKTIIDLCESIRKPVDTPYGLIGMTIGYYGIVQQDGIYLPSRPNQRLSISSLTDTLSRHFNAPIYLESDANLSAIGEMSQEHHPSNLAALRLHSGVDLGIIHDHRICSANWQTCHFGHTIIHIHGRECYCGHQGCLEQYVSEAALLYALSEKKQVSNLTLDELYHLYTNKDPDTLLILEDFTGYLAAGINNIIQVFQPDEVVINSDLIKMIPEILDQVRSHLANGTLKEVMITYSNLLDRAPLLGGVCVAANRFLGLETASPQVWRDNWFYPE